MVNAAPPCCTARSNATLPLRIAGQYAYPPAPVFVRCSQARLRWFKTVATDRPAEHIGCREVSPPWLPAADLLERNSPCLPGSAGCCRFCAVATVSIKFRLLPGSSPDKVRPTSGIWSITPRLLACADASGNVSLCRLRLQRFTGGGSAITLPRSRGRRSVPHAGFAVYWPKRPAGTLIVPDLAAVGILLPDAPESGIQLTLCYLSCGYAYPTTGATHEPTAPSRTTFGDLMNTCRGQRRR